MRLPQSLRFSVITKKTYRENTLLALNKNSESVNEKKKT